MIPIPILHYFAAMRKTSLFGLISALLVLVSCNQESSHQAQQPAQQSSNAVALYNRAQAMGDNLTAIVALNQILLEDSSNTAFKDSLATLYLLNRQNKAGLLLGQEVLAVNPDNDKLLELVSYAQELTGDTENAIIGFAKLFESSKDERYRYEIAKIHYTSKDAKSANAKLKEVSENKESTATVEMLAQEGTQMVPIQAAAYYLMAQIAIDRNQQTTAINNLKQALGVYPGFEQAAYGLQQIQAFLAQQRDQAELQRMQKSREAAELERLQKKYGNQ